MNIYKILKEIDTAYPEDIFPPLTKEEVNLIADQYPGFIDRASAAMGRHLAQVIRRKLAEPDEDQEGEGSRDVLFNAAVQLLYYRDKYGSQEFKKLFGSLDVLDVCRQILSEGEGNPHPWQGKT